MKNKKENNKKPDKKANSSKLEKSISKAAEMSMSMFEFKKPELSLDDKKIKAIKTIMDDPCLRYKDNSELKALVEGYDAAKKTPKKGDKK